MNKHTKRSSMRTVRDSVSRTLAASLCLAFWLGGLSSRAQTTNQGTVLAWNNLGMHCMDSDFSVFCILPPYNVVNAQAIDATGLLVGGANGVTVTYASVADATGSINTTSAGKMNFWQYAQLLFGITLAPDVGLPVPGPNSYAMPGVNNKPQTMEFDATPNWFAAYGIPISPVDDAGNTNRYPMMRVTAKSGVNILDSTDIVLPISTEMDCRACHASGSGPAAQPANGWVNLTDRDRDYRLNILRLHDDRQVGTPVFATALNAAGYNAAGLYATVVVGLKPILCAACHHSEALPGSGQTGVPPLTESIHSLHGAVSDPATGTLLGSELNRTSCYYCHPGQTTRCLRGIMGASVAADGSLAMECESCHGAMNQVGAATRTGWLDEPNCQARSAIRRSLPLPPSCAWRPTR